ncbi:MAG: hypothetical protein E7562_03125 [Ruminococcaceae bacterium]|nr:hypothetical protein [Oscillospiraceae bacterium]
MSFGMFITTVLEIAAVVFVLWAVFHEDRFAAFEKRIFARIRRSRLKVVRGGRTNSNKMVGNRKVF